MSGSSSALIYIFAVPPVQSLPPIYGNPSCAISGSFSWSTVSYFGFPASTSPTTLCGQQNCIQRFLFDIQDPPRSPLLFWVSAPSCVYFSPPAQAGPCSNLRQVTNDQLSLRRCFNSTAAQITLLGLLLLAFAAWDWGEEGEKCNKAKMSDLRRGR